MFSIVFLTEFGPSISSFVGGFRGSTDLEGERSQRFYYYIIIYNLR